MTRVICPLPASRTHQRRHRRQGSDKGSLHSPHSAAIPPSRRLPSHSHSQIPLIELHQAAFRWQAHPRQQRRECASRVVCRLGATPLFDPSRLHVEFNLDPPAAPLSSSSQSTGLSQNQPAQDRTRDKKSQQQHAGLAHSNQISVDQVPAKHQQQHFQSQPSPNQSPTGQQQHPTPSGASQAQSSQVHTRQQQQLQVVQPSFRVEGAFAAQEAQDPTRSILPRCYTVTHSDVTGDIFVAVGPDTKHEQLQSLSTKLFRDEVVAEWKLNSTSTLVQPPLSLHIHCHVSGGHPFLAPGHLRNWIFQREMPLVLQCICHAERQLLSLCPELRLSPVWVHYHSSNPQLDRADCWGPLSLAVTREYEEPLSQAFISLFADWRQKTLLHTLAVDRPRPAFDGSGGAGLYQAGSEFAAWMAHPRHVSPFVWTLAFAFVLWMNTVVLNFPLLALD